MLLLVLAALLAVVCFHSFYWKRRHLPPGPLPLPVLGNILTILKHSPGYGAFEQFRREYGDVYTYWLGSSPVVAVAEFKLLTETFVKNGDDYAGRSCFGDLPVILRGGHYGVVFTSGKDWQEQRRFAMQVFRNLGMGKNVLEQKILIEFEQLFNDLTEQIGDSGEKELNVAHALEVTVASVINQMLFGFSYQDKAERAKFAQIKDILTEHMVKAISPRVQIIADFPLLRFLPPFKQAMDDFQFGYDTITKYCRDELEKHKKVFDPQNEPNDYLEAYLGEIHKDKNSNFTEVQCINVAYDIWIAGQETTSNTLIFALLYALHNPDKLQRLQKELDAVVPSGRRVTSADRSALPYTNAFIYEVQRLVNLLPQNLVHKVTRDVVLDGYLIKKGTDIVPQISTVLYDEKVFPEPARFKPERFLDDRGNLKRVDEFIPFSLGKRQCLGEALAKVELYLLVANFFSNFSVEPVEGRDLPSLRKKPGVTIQPERFTCVVKRRSK